MSKCFQPLYLRKKNRLVPCGKCWFCLSQKRAEWDFRLLTEASYSACCFFLTLTYSNEFLPLYHCMPTLYPRHLDLYWKTLRNHGFKFSYFVIGEYGGKFGRPHYHVLIFFPTSVVYPIYLKHFWLFGRVSIDKVEPASIHYVTKFHVMPKMPNSLSEVRRPFSRMSKGIGYQWLGDHCYFSPPPSIRIGKYSYPFPRYYRKLLGFDSSDGVFSFPFSDSSVSLYYKDFSERRLRSYHLHSNFN